MNKYIKFLVQFSKFVKLNKENQLMKPMFVAREREGGILSHVYFSNICNLIKSFLALKQNIGKGDITFLLSSSSRAIEWRNEYLIKLKSYVDQIDTSRYIDFKINKKIFQ